MKIKNTKAMIATALGLVLLAGTAEAGTGFLSTDRELWLRFYDGGDATKVFASSWAAGASDALFVWATPGCLAQGPSANVIAALVAEELRNNVKALPLNAVRNGLARYTGCAVADPRSR